MYDFNICITQEWWQFFFSFLFWDWVSCIPGWPWTCHIAKDLTLDSSASTSHVVGKGMCHHSSLHLGLESRASCILNRNSANWAAFPAGWKLFNPLDQGYLSPDLVPHNHSVFPFTPEHYSVDQIPFKNKTKRHCLNLVFLIISGDISLSIHVNIFNDFFQFPRIVFYKYIHHLSGDEHIAFLYLLNSSIYPLLDTGKIVISQA